MIACSSMKCKVRILVSLCSLCCIYYNTRCWSATHTPWGRRGRRGLAEFMAPDMRELRVHCQSQVLLGSPALQHVLLQHYTARDAPALQQALHQHNSKGYTNTTARAAPTQQQGLHQHNSKGYTNTTARTTPTQQQELHQHNSKVCTNTTAIKGELEPDLSAISR